MCPRVAEVTQTETALKLRLPLAHMQEPASVASTTRQTNTEHSSQLFRVPAAKHVGTDVYSRVLMPASASSIPNSGVEPTSANAAEELLSTGNKLTAGESVNLFLFI